MGDGHIAFRQAKTFSNHRRLNGWSNEMIAHLWVSSTAKGNYMSRKLSILLAAAALSLSSGFVHADGFPSSPNETGPVAIESSSGTAAAGATREDAPLRTVGPRDADSYEVRTPSSINESAPWLIDGQKVPTVRMR
jgi:hypothetical protein